MKVAFQGVRGAYSEVAARHLFGKRCATLPCGEFAAVFTSVEKRRADRGIIPIENSLAGSIHQNYDLLLEHKLHIVGEVHLRIEHALMCSSKSSLRNISVVRSHPQALAQCAAFFRKHKRLKPEAFFDTAGAAQSVAESDDETVAAIASKEAARLYGLKILKRNLESKSHNFTRFLVVGRSPVRLRPSDNTKCSIVFSPKTNKTGILFTILGVFAVRGIDLLKVESRPDPKSPFQYLFYLDLQGNPADPDIREAFMQVRELTRMFRVLGAYPMGKGNFYGARP